MGRKNEEKNQRKGVLSESLVFIRTNLKGCTSEKEKEREEKPLKERGPGIDSLTALCSMRNPRTESCL